MTDPRPPAPAPDDAVLAAALDAWRRDVAAVAPGPFLAERVLRAAAVGDAETVRFRRLARIYAAAAAVMAVVGVAGGLLAHRAAPSVAVAGRPPSVHDLEDARLARLGEDSVRALTVGAR